jgi:peroxiredoxin
MAHNSLASGFFSFASEAVGKKAEVFSLEDTKGNKVDLSQFIGKKPVILFFWTTWCPHCRAQISRLKEESEKIKKTGAELILIDIDESPARVDSFLKNAGGNFTSLLDHDSRVSEKYGIIGIPTFVLVGGDGIIRSQDNLLPSDYPDILNKK